MWPLQYAAFSLTQEYEVVLEQTVGGVEYGFDGGIERCSLDQTRSAQQLNVIAGWIRNREMNQNCIELSDSTDFFQLECNSVFSHRLERADRSFSSAFELSLLRVLTFPRAEANISVRPGQRNQCNALILAELL